jgi:Mrp family chromosome partitioning ATPase
MSEECTSSCETCSSNCSDRTKPESLIEKTNEMSNVKKVIAVVSGKGGVGKSLVTSMMAVLSQRKGFKTAILDADITGPSIPKAFGINQKAAGNESGIFPVETKTGIELMSINLLLENHTDPVVWRGPIIAGTVKQFWTDVIWNEVDYMFVDMPPGTGDVPLTVFQSLPVDGIIIVTSPQELVSMIVEKAVKMAKMMNIPIYGIVENMSYFVCPNCKEQHYIFGKSHIEEITAKYEIKNIAKIPIDAEISSVCDKGLIELFEGDWLNQLSDRIEEC